MKLHHIGIAVKNLKQAIERWGLLGLPEYGTEVVSGEKVQVAFMGADLPKIELLEATQHDSVVAQFIEKKGEGIHHICFQVKNIEEAMKKLQSQQVSFTTPSAKKGSQGSRVAFIYPKHFNGVLVELRETGG